MSAKFYPKQRDYIEILNALWARTATTFRDAWNAGTAYDIGDLVTDAGSTYYRKVAGTTATIPGSDSTNWTVWAAAATLASTLLTGLSTASAADVTAADNALVGFGKLQAQLTRLGTSTGSEYIGFVQSGTGAVLRTLESKLRDTTRTVTDFGAPVDGVTDALAACQAARDSVASGQAVHLIFPRGAYYLSADLTSNGRLLHVTREDGSTLTGPGIIYANRTEQVTGSQRKINIQGDNGGYEANVLGTATYIESNGSDGGYGNLFSYESYRTAIPVAAGDIGVHHRARWHSSTGTGLWVRWTVGVSPLTLTNEYTWGLVGDEVNVVDNGPDRGWAAFPGADTWSGGHMVVPDVWAPSGSLGGNILFSYGVFQSTALNARGPGTTPVGPGPYHPRTYNGFLIGLNGIAPDGRGAYFDGSDSASSTDYPNAPLQIAHKWKHGLRADTATISDNLALLLGATQAIAWVDGSALATNGLYSGTGSPESVVTAGIGSLFLRRDGGVGTAAYFKQATGNTGWAAFDLTPYAPLASPALTGTPTAPTAIAGTNTTQISTTAFVQAAITAAVSGMLTFKSTIDCSANPNYPAAVKGDAYIVSVAGKIGGASGTAVDVGDWIVAEATVASGTEAVVGASWGHMEHNLVGALLASNNLSDLLSASAARTNLGLGTLATQSGTFSGTSSGNNTGDQTITLTGNVTGTGTGSFATTIAASAVTLAMHANLAASSIMGNNTVSPAAPLALTATQVKSLLAIANTDVSGLGTMSTQAANSVAITGGAIDGTTVGATTVATGKFSSVETTGAVGIGGAVPTSTTLDIQKTITGATISRAVWQRGTVQSGVTVLGIGYENSLATQAASFTLGDYRHFFAQQGTLGASSVVSSQTGFYADSTLSGATANFGFLSALAAATGSWNFYGSGTAANFFNGVTTFGTKFGYGTQSGVGGAVTQSASKSNGVTLNTACGAITMNGAALGATTSVSFTLTCSSIGANDIIDVHRKSGGTAGAYDIYVDSVAAGSCVIRVKNNTAGSLSEAVVLSYAITSGTIT